MGPKFSSYARILHLWVVCHSHLVSVLEGRTATAGKHHKEETTVQELGVAAAVLLFLSVVVVIGTDQVDIGVAAGGKHGLTAGSNFRKTMNT